MSLFRAAVLAMILVPLLALGMAAWRNDVKTAERERLQAQAAVQLKAEAQRQAALAASLQDRLAAADAARAQAKKERDDAINRATTGRACLGSSALRVLDGAPGLRVAARPDTTASPDATHAALAADTGERGREPEGPADAGQTAAAGLSGPVATDTGVARWMLAAGAQYEQCRARLDALIDYVAAPPANAAKATP